MKMRKIIALAVAALIGLAVMTIAEAPPAMAAASAGPAWTVVPSANIPGSAYGLIFGVSCTSPTWCVGVGYTSIANAGIDQTLIETWDGTSWSIASSPSTSPTLTNQLFRVSCTSRTACVAVGSASNGTTEQTLIEAWDGTSWSIASSPNTSPTLSNALANVSCTSPTSCVAVGTASNGTSDQTLIETWDGSAWSITPSPNTSPTQANQLSGVSCTSATACVAVGYAFNGTNDQTLIETWGGSAWSIAPSPDTSPTQTNQLIDVSCTSATACVAVGWSDPPAVSQNLIVAWDGSSWTITPSPNASASFSQLASVSCSTPTSCVAVGYTNFGDYDALSQILTWDGATWSLTPNPLNLTPNGNVIVGVSCTSPTACVAVGGYISDTINTVATMVLSAVSSGGYRLAATDGGVFAYGSSPFFGSAGAIHLNKPVVGTASTPNDQGYWLVATDGGVFAYGNAGFYGSTGAITLNEPIVGMAATADGKGYWLVASDGGVFAYGDAAFYGSMGGSPLNKPIVGMSRTNDGKGYWLVATDGGVFAYGDAVFSGSTGATTLAKPIVGMAASPIGTGYWLVAADGGIFSYGGAAFLGSTGGQVLTHPIVGMSADQTGHGYWLAASGGGVFAFGDAPPLGNQAGFTIANPIVGIAG